MTNDIETKIRESFARQGMMGTLGARITGVGDGTCAISAPITPETSQQMGFAHAGLTFAIGDSAAGYAALTQLADGEEVVTTEMKINLLAPAQGSTLEAEGRVIRAGRRLLVVAADVYAQDVERRRHVATLMGSMMPVRP